MWYFAKVQLRPGMERQLRQDLLWGEAHLPKSMVGLEPKEGETRYLFGYCHSNTDICHTGELADLEQYFEVLEFGQAEPFFVGDHASSVFSTELVARRSPAYAR